MRLEKREISPVEKERTGKEREPDIEKFLKNECPNLVSGLESKEKNIRENTEKEKRKSPAIKETIEALDNAAKESGFKEVLLAPEGGIGTEAWPLGVVIFFPRSISNYEKLRYLMPGLAKEGFKAYLDSSKEEWKGDAWEKSKERFEKLEKVKKLNEKIDIPPEITITTEEMKKRFEVLKNLEPSKKEKIQGLEAEFIKKIYNLLLPEEKAKEVLAAENKIEEITEEEMRLIEEVAVQANRQYFEKTKKNLGEKNALENIAKMEAFSELVKFGLQAKTGKEQWSKYSSTAYPFLEKNFREEIGKIVINIEKEVQDKKGAEEKRIYA